MNWPLSVPEQDRLFAALAANDADADDAQAVAQMQQHREDAGRSPEALRVAGLQTRGPKSRAWQVLS